jgi:parvulin-like peptidyl-prolyl isomerase
MQLTKRQINQLIKILETTQQILADANRETPRASQAVDGATRTRRTGKDLAAFKKTVKAERKSGASVAELARKYGVTPSYLYQLR